MIVRLTAVLASVVMLVACSDSGVSLESSQDKSNQQIASPDPEINSPDSEINSPDSETDSPDPETDSRASTNMLGQVTAGYAQCDVSAATLSGNLIGDDTSSSSTGEFEIDLGEYQGALIVTASKV